MANADHAVMWAICSRCKGPVGILVRRGQGPCPRCGNQVELPAETRAEAIRLSQANRSARPATLTTAQVRPRPAEAIILGPPPPVMPGTEVANEPATGARGGHMLPSWLVSLVVHAVALVVLGLVMIDERTRQDLLILATNTGLFDRLGDDDVIETRELPTSFESILSADERRMVEPPLAATDQFELATALPAVGDMSQFMVELNGGPTMLANPFDMAGGFGLRNPETRAQMALREGGTSATEAAVARGLAWLARHQSYDGSWRLDQFHHDGDCEGQCAGQGSPSDSAGTALALLPFLGAGETHLRGQYRANVERGLRWLVDSQRENGDLRGLGSGAMYAHGQATIALCEAYGLTGDQTLRDPAQRAVDFIVDAQHRRGGWRYSPGEPGDTSVVGWQLMALRSAQMAYLNVPEEVFRRAATFLNSVQTESRRGLFSYMPGGGATPSMTAEGLLCRQYYGWSSREAALREGVRWLLASHPPSRERDMYYWYYGTQVMHHHGGPEWRKWNEQVSVALVEMQEVDGHQAGSWSPRDSFDHAGGRIYTTALAVCTLEVYYRHLPLYRASAAKK